MGGASETLSGLKKEIADLKKRIRDLERTLAGRNEPEKRESISARNYRIVADNTYDWEWWLDPDYRFIYCSPSCRRITGHGAEEFLSDPDLLIRIIHPDFRDEFLLHEKGALSAIHDRQIELLIIRADGTERWIGHVCQTLHDESGAFIGTRGSNRDITDRKQAEEALRRSEDRLSAIIEFLPDPTFAIDREGRIIVWNRALEEMTGIAARAMLGKGDYEYALPFYGERRPLLVDLLFAWDDRVAKKYSTIERDGDIFYGETNEVRIQAGRRTIWVKASALRDEKGSVVGAIETIRDITDRKRTEEERKRLISDLREALNKVKTLSGLLPICASCKRIRNDKGYWEQIEVYIREHSDAEFTHGICPECGERLYPEFYKKK